MAEPSIGNPVQPCISEEKEAKKNGKKHFVKFNLVDDTGTPLEGIKIQVIFSDESSTEALSDKEGLISLTDIPPGKVTLVSDWRQEKVEDIVLIQ